MVLHKCEWIFTRKLHDLQLLAQILRKLDDRFFRSRTSRHDHLFGGCSYDGVRPCPAAVTIIYELHLIDDTDIHIDIVVEHLYRGADVCRIGI